jgi:hypothetical protein
MIYRKQSAKNQPEYNQVAVKAILKGYAALNTSTLSGIISSSVVETL